MTIVLHHSQARGTEKLVLMGIANHDGDGGAWPSINTLAKYANVDARTAQRAVAALGSKGELVIYTQGGGSRSMPDHKRPNRYEITLKCPPNCDRSSKHKLVDNYNQALFSVPQLRVTPVSPGDASVTPPGDASVTPTGDTSVTRTIIKNPPQNPSVKAGHSPAQEHICWTCGKPGARSAQGYCVPCETRGMNSPMISCHCGLKAGRRQHRGQTHFFCPECPPKEALDGMKAQA